jgi:E3 ubiquitin-protein ligase mind-bomb
MFCSFKKGYFSNLQVKCFLPDDLVRIIEDVSLLVRLQQDHGDWSPEMNEAAGKTGRIVKVYADGDVRVKVIENTWTFNPGKINKTSEDQF